MANHNLPTLTSTYANFITEMDARMDDISIGFDPAFTTVGNPNYNASLSQPTNIITGTIRWTSSGSKWQKWSGTVWNDLSSLYAISISGNAATVTSGVYTTGSYADPAWLTSLAGSKISGNITGNAGTATKLATARNINGVAFDGSAAINLNLNNALTISSAGGGSATGTTFTGSAAATISYDSIGAPSVTGTNATGTWAISITGDCGGNAATVSNGVYTTGDQTIAGTKYFSGAIKASSGNAATAGIVWPDNIGGGSGDSAYIRYYIKTGEACRMEIGVANDADDDLYLNVDSALVKGNLSAYASDARLKKNFVRIPNALAKVNSISGYIFDWDVEKCKEVGFKPYITQNEHGFKAQEILDIVADAVTRAPFDDNGAGSSRSGKDYLTVKYDKLVPLLVEAIKELTEELNQLKAKVN